MFNDLLKLKRCSTICLDDEIALDFASMSDFSVKSIAKFKFGKQKLVCISINDFYLIANSIQGEHRFFLCSLYDQGQEYLSDKLDFLEEIEVREKKQRTLYKIFDSSPCHKKTGTSFGFYESASYFLIIQSNSEETLIYQGIEISEESIQI